MTDGNYAKAVEMFSRAIEKKNTYYAKAQQNLERARAAMEQPSGSR